MTRPRQPPSHGLDYDARAAQLIDLAEQLFIERGYAAFSMEELARRAEVSRPVVYRHFSTKEEALLACVRRARAAYQDDLMREIARAATPREQLAAGARASFAMLETDPGRWRLVFGTNALLPGEQAGELQRLRFDTIAVVADALRANAKDGTEDLQIDVAAHAVSGVTERVGHWLLTRPDLTLDQAVDLYVEFVWPAIAPFTRED